MSPDPLRIVVVGASGMLGRALVAELTARGLPQAAPPRAELDLLRTPDLEAALGPLEPRAVINASAFTDVGAAERPEQREAAYALNRDAPGRLARACVKLGVPLLHVSTDYVFDGRLRRPYLEQDATAPLQVYGASKLAGEHEVLASGAEALIARTSTLYGPGPRPRPHYVDAILRQAREHGRLELVRPPVSSPTHAPDLAWGLVELCEAGARGIVNVVNAGGCSRIDLATEALRLDGRLERVEIHERPEPQGGLERPAYSILDVERFAELTGKRMRPWREGLADYVGGGSR